MWYEINVSLNGQHFFATADRSITDEVKLKKIVPVFVQKFPESEGYNISVSRMTCSGRGMDIDKLMNG